MTTNLKSELYVYEQESSVCTLRGHKTCQPITLMTTAECNRTTKKEERKRKEDSQVAVMPRQATGETNYYRAHHNLHTPAQKGQADKWGNQ